MSVIGPGKYDHLCTTVRQQTNARGVLLIVLGGNKGSGFSAQLQSDLAFNIPDILRQVADEMEGKGQ